jgi:hypothetical protein
VNDWTRSWGFHRGPCPAWSCSTLRKVIFASSETQALRKKSQEKASAATSSSARAAVRLTGQELNGKNWEMVEPIGIEPTTS